jgi:hypothetical protein
MMMMMIREEWDLVLFCSVSRLMGGERISLFCYMWFMMIRNGKDADHGLKSGGDEQKFLYETL